MANMKDLIGTSDEYDEIIESMSDSMQTVLAHIQVTSLSDSKELTDMDISSVVTILFVRLHKLEARHEKLRQAYITMVGEGNV